ncbi:FAD-binding protein [Mollicutes bacterium LVI A0039]|nr:FAD-binding protein [Mollicutes bacterium LVI A0039]
MNKIFDLIIVGSGPSGSALSMLMQDAGIRIALIDKRNFDEEYDINNNNLKSCGGLLSEAAQASISALNLNIPNEVLESPQILNVKTFDFDNNLIESYKRSYLNMNREKFDRFLYKQTVSSNVEKIMSAMIIKLEKVEDLYAVTYKAKSGELITIKSRILVGADGAKSKVRNTFFKENNRKAERYASYQKVYKNAKVSPQFICVFGSEITDYYGWGFTKGDLFYLGFGSKPGVDATAKFELMKSKLVAQGYEFGEEFRSEGTVLIRPSKVSKIVSADGSCYLIGEAGKFISPSSAEGISFALNSAIALADSFHHSSDLSKVSYQYKRNTKYLRRKVKLRNIKAQLLSNKTLRGVVMKSRITAINKVR